MYDMLVTKAIWGELRPLVKAEKSIVRKHELLRYRQEVNRVKEQYLSKIMPPTNRILLGGLKDRLLRDRNANITLNFDEVDKGEGEREQAPFNLLLANISRDLFGFSIPDENRALDAVDNPGVGIIPETTRNFMQFAKMLRAWSDLRPSVVSAQEVLRPPSLDQLVSLFGPALFESNLDNAFLACLAGGSGYSQLARYVIKRAERFGSGYLLVPESEETAAGDLGVAPLLVCGCYYRGCVQAKAFDSLIHFGIKIVLPSIEVQRHMRERPSEENVLFYDEGFAYADAYADDLLRYLDLSNSPSAAVVASRFRSRVAKEIGEASREPAQSEVALKQGASLRDGWAIVHEPPDDDVIGQFFSIRQQSLFREYWLQDIYVALGRIADFAEACRGRRARTPVPDSKESAAMVIGHSKLLALVLQASDHLPAAEIHAVEYDSIKNEQIAWREILKRNDFVLWEMLATSLSDLVLKGSRTSVPPFHMPPWVVGHIFEGLAANLRVLGREKYGDNNPSHWVAAFLNSMLVHESIWRGCSGIFSSLAFRACCDSKRSKGVDDPFVYNLKLVKKALGAGEFGARGLGREMQWGIPVTTLFWACCPPLFAALCAEPLGSGSPCLEASQAIIECYVALQESDPYDGTRGDHWRHNELLRVLAKKESKSGENPILRMLKDMMPPSRAP